MSKSLKLKLSNPQSIFLHGLNTKFRAYVGGFGCVHPETKVHTEHGLMRICDIDRPMRVVSWCEKDQKFQLSLSGGAYPKGKANLYRVVTQQGEFVASGHHRSLCADGKYRRVDSLSAGDELSSFGKGRHSTSSEFDLKSLPLGDGHSSQILEGLMGNYANEARRYGRQLLSGEDFSRGGSPSQGDAQIFAQSSCQSGRQELEQLHSRPCRLTDPQTMSRSSVRTELPAYASEDRIFSLSFERILRYLQEYAQSLLMSFGRRKDLQLPSVYHSLFSSLSKTTILSIEQLECQDEYWDMQVLDTNNYVTEDGCIHHNSGKTFVGCLDLLLFFGKHPGTRQGYFGPTYGAIRDIFYPTFEEAAHMLGFRVEIRESNKEVHVYRGKAYYGTVICRSMDNPASIVGFKISRALVDEIDVLDAKKANNAWNKIIARMRLVIPGEVNGIGVTTTPEGFKFTYDRFADSPESDYSMVQASTYENEQFLPPDYIQSLKASYPQELITAYLNGEFVNLNAGTVYRSYNRVDHRSTETINGGEPLFVGMDFNIDKMAATVFVLRDKAYHAVAEISNGYNTPTVAQMLKDRYQDNQIIIYPDSSGKNRTRMGGASESDIDILRNEFNFECRFRPQNPPVRDRINSANAAFEKGHLFVNDKACPNTAACLEQQVYDDNGEPDKKGGKDHQNDATTYPIAYELPIRKPAFNIDVGFVM